MENDGRWFTTEDAAKHAQVFCESNPQWVRVCDLENGELEALQFSWDELLPRERRPWEDRYGPGAQTCWEEFSTRNPLRHRWGHVSGSGEFVADICDVPFGHNTMMVVEKYGKPGRYWSPGKDARSGLGRAT